jgi:hypothetical protein
LSDFCWAKASPGNEASPNAVIAQRMLRRFIVFLHGPDSGARAHLRAHAKRMLLGRGLLIEDARLSAAAGKRDLGTTLAAIDRLVHHATILEMNVESYRRKAALKRKRGPAD